MLSFLKRLVGRPARKTCTVCLGSGLNCFTCDEEGVPVPRDARAVYALGGKVEYIQCDIGKCCHCRGGGRVHPAYDVEAIAFCKSCNQAFGEVRSVPCL